MKKINTNSYFVSIYELKDKKIIKRRKRTGLHAYPRTFSLMNINNILNQTKIYFPKIYLNGIKYTYEEFIESTTDIDKISNLELMKVIIDYISQLYQIDLSKRYKKNSWHNNSDFLRFQINNLKEVLINKNPSKLDMYLKDLERLYKKVDNDRKMCFIHGDIHRGNIIINKNKYYLIDWELATYGDLAYEVATHFILMEYSEEEQEIFVKSLCKKIPMNIETFKNDISIYIAFEKCRRNILKAIKN